MQRNVQNFQWLRGRGLTIALVFGYLIMALVAREQARTISSQSALIRELFQDSLQLSAMRMQQQSRQNSAGALR